VESQSYRLVWLNSCSALIPLIAPSVQENHFVNKVLFHPPVRLVHKFMVCRPRPTSSKYKSMWS
jgi:hypothetical protein